MKLIIGTKFRNPKNDGGSSNNWAVIAGGLPDGLMLNTQNGQITGTPTTESINSQVTIQANNSGGSDTFDMVIQVSPPDDTDQPMDDQYVAIEVILLINVLAVSFIVGLIRREMRKEELGDTY